MRAGSCVDQNGNWNLGNRWLGYKMQGVSWQHDKSWKSMWAGAQQLEEHVEASPLPFCMGTCFNSLMCRMRMGEATCIFLPKSRVGKVGCFGLVAWRLILRSYMILLVSPLKGLEIHPKGSDPLLGLVSTWETCQKPTEWVGAGKQLSIQNGRVLGKKINCTYHFEGMYMLPGFLISLLFRIWALLACLDPVAQKRHHFVATCCSASNFFHAACSPSFLYGNGLTLAHWYLFFFTV